MIIKSRMKDYEVVFEKDASFFSDLVKKENAFYVISQTVYRVYGDLFKNIKEDDLFVLSSMEGNKTIDVAMEICEKITRLPGKRNATLISIGGGVIQDLTGFVASVMYRGIHWIFVPTTLLSACDSCIGGKTSLNYQKYKNLLGTFYPPDEIHIWSKMFQTLSDRDFKSGLGEVVKFNIMSGENGLTDMEENLGLLLGKNKRVIDAFVDRSLSYKKRFIEIDEFDRGERIKLNFAHTFGHAIEVVSEYEIPHGTAVAIGMIMANHISFCRDYLAERFIRRSEALLLKIIDIDIGLIEKPLEDYLKAIKKDKKQIDNSVTAVLITRFGESGELSIVHDVKREEIKGAIEHFISIYKVKNL